MPSKNELQRKVVDTGLCTGCGMCYSVCPASVIEIEAFKNNGEPVFNNKKCTKCNLCLECCPGMDDFWGTSFHLHEGPFIRDDCYYIGPVKSTYLSHSMDIEERNNSASGGTASSICRFLLDNDIVDAVVGVGFRNGIEPSPLIIKNSGDLKLISQSKYVRVPNCKVIKDDNIGNSVCFIGLPCHLKAMKKAIKHKLKFTKKIKILIGLYCGNGLYFDATISLIKKLGCKNPDEAESIRYREGQWPGNFTLKKKNGESKSISKMTFNYLSFFYTPKRCYLCNELPSFDTDITLADGWAKEGIDTEGWNCVIARTDLGNQVINNACKNGYLNVERVTKEDAINMHRHGMYNKHYLANLRCRIMESLGIKTPQYSKFNADTKDYISALLTLLFFTIGNMKISRFFSGFLPFSFYENLMSSSRRKWRKIS